MCLQGIVYVENVGWLGGDCKTSVIVCNSMDSKNAAETMRFGERYYLLL